MLLYPDSKNKEAFEQGLEFQDFIMERMTKLGFYLQCYSSRSYQIERGESVQRAEIKLDNRCTETGRLSIEVAERTAIGKPWVPSGIMRQDNSIFYIQGNRKLFFMFDKRFLIRWHDYKLHRKIVEKPTVKTFYISLEQAKIYSILFVEDGTP